MSWSYCCQLKGPAGNLSKHEKAKWQQKRQHESMRGWAWQDGGGKIKAWSHRNLTQLTSWEANATVFVWWYNVSFSHLSLKKIEEKFRSKIKLKFCLPSSDLDNTAVCNNKGVRLTRKLESNICPKRKAWKLILTSIMARGKWWKWFWKLEA